MTLLDVMMGAGALMFAVIALIEFAAIFAQPRSGSVGPGQHFKPGTAERNPDRRRKPRTPGER